MGKHDAAVASLGDEPVVSLVGVDLKNTAEALQLPQRMLVASPRGIDIGDSGWPTAAPGALVASIFPQGAPVLVLPRLGSSTGRGVSSLKITGEAMMPSSRRWYRRSSHQAARPTH